MSERRRGRVMFRVAAFLLFVTHMCDARVAFIDESIAAYVSHARVVGNR